MEVVPSSSPRARWVKSGVDIEEVVIGYTVLLHRWADLFCINGELKVFL